MGRNVFLMRGVLRHVGRVVAFNVFRLGGDIYRVRGYELWAQVYSFSLPPANHYKMMRLFQHLQKDPGRKDELVAVAATLSHVATTELDRTGVYSSETNLGVLYVNMRHALGPRADKAQEAVAAALAQQFLALFLDSLMEGVAVQDFLDAAVTKLIAAKAARALPYPRIIEISDGSTTSSDLSSESDAESYDTEEVIILSRLLSSRISCSVLLCVYFMPLTKTITIFGGCGVNYVVSTVSKLAQRTTLDAGVRQQAAALAIKYSEIDEAAGIFEIWKHLGDICGRDGKSKAQ
ncbi:hypothetical protein CC80DRAFT_499492 [Byssothecium circinans]|uniref:Uncharacterized protein n=1 Tax=Byssothecium circinans TaxID=147558 RepID=A0A6A5UAW9_9PLEO|nr:hypothetical protein CC80DRAFT_499492 [Byssothecium circinans]